MILSNSDIQQLLDNPDSMGRVELPAGEFEGRFTVRRSCTINGNGAVLWSAFGPVLVIESRNVKINNLKIELTSDNISDERRISVCCRYPDTKFTDTEINGALIGIPCEEQYWGIPKTISLGVLAAERQESFSLELYAPTETEIRCGLYGVTLSQEFLTKGYNTVTLTVGKIRGGSALYGNIFLKSAVTRKIFISGTIGGRDIPPPQHYMLFSADREASAKYAEMLAKLDISRLAEDPIPSAEQFEIPLDEIGKSEQFYEFETESVEILPSKRFPLAPRRYRIELTYVSARTRLDIDAYMFMLNDSGRVKRNSRMIFFGNDHSECGSVRYLNAPDKRALFVDFGSIPSDVNRMVLLFSVYGDDPSRLFDKLSGAQIGILCENGVKMHLKLESNLHCRTILAFGFELSDGVWEVIPSGKAVGMPLAEICRSYGVAVV